MDAIRPRRARTPNIRIGDSPCAVFIALFIALLLTGCGGVDETKENTTSSVTSGNPASYSLSVTKSGSGTVTSSPAGINCGATCSASFASGTSVTLTATAASGYSFSGWSGGCSGTGSCTVSMTQARSVTANFSQTTTGNSAALAWDPPTSITNLSGYRVYYGTAPGVYQQAYGQGLSVGNVTTYTVVGLSHNTRYYFAVTAFDTAGNESTYSNEVFKDIP